MPRGRKKPRRHSSSTRWRCFSFGMVAGVEGAGAGAVMMVPLFSYLTCVEASLCAFLAGIK